MGFPISSPAFCFEIISRPCRIIRLVTGFILYFFLQLAFSFARNRSSKIGQTTLRIGIIQPEISTHRLQCENAAVCSACGLPTRLRHFCFEREILKIAREKVSSRECTYFIGRTIRMKQRCSYSLFYKINNCCMTARTVEQYYIHITRTYLILLVKWRLYGKCWFVVYQNQATAGNTAVNRGSKYHRDLATCKQQQSLSTSCARTNQRN